MEKKEKNSEESDGNSSKTQCSSKTQGTCLLTIEELDDEGDSTSLTDVDTTALAFPFPANLRRNSISMPSGLNALEDFEALRMKHRMICLQEDFEEDETSDLIDSISEYSINNNQVEIMTTEDNVLSIDQTTMELTQDSNNNNQINKIGLEDDDDWGFPNTRKKDRFRSRRRASIAPLPALRLNDKEMLASDFDTYSLASNQASITSVNSVASLLREKMQAFPQIIRKKKRETKDYKLKIFVILMFFIIIFLISYAYVGYHHHVSSYTYFENIKFDPIERELKILQDTSEGSIRQSVIIAGQLGVTMGQDNHPFHCLADHRRSDGSLCIEWNGMARLYMNYYDRNVFRCYRLYWQALSDHIDPTDCYELSRDNLGLWFGGGITKDFYWSLSESDFDYTPFTSGDARIHQFGNGVRRYFISTLGVAIDVEESTPLYLKVNTTSNQFCLKAKHDDFTFVNHFSPYPELSYRICTTSDMKSLHTLMTQKSLWDGLKEADIKLLHSLIEEPIWQIPHQNNIDSINETTVYDYSEEVIAMGFMSLGHILINEFWQENIGDFTIDQERFPTLKETIDVLHRRGFKVVFTIQPFISTDSINFKEAVHKKLLIYERHSERSIPALTRYKSAVSAGVLDITNNAVVPWIMEKLERLRKDYQVDSFYLDLGVSYNLPHYYECRQTLYNSDKYSSYWIESLPNISFIGVSTASSIHRPPTFLSTLPTNSTWAGLQETLVTVINYGLIGYPFVLPATIGGDYSTLSSKVSNHKMIFFYSLQQSELPDEELYIRWLQLSTFMPAMQFSHLPTEYRSDYIVKITKELMFIRKTIVVPLLKKYLTESLNDGLPLVRPLWMLDPHDPACLSANNEFSVGEELIVAPILEEHIENREVYLPQGVWKDGIDGSLRKGSRWMHSYKVPKDKIAYFIKMPDNTRF